MSTKDENQNEGSRDLQLRWYCLSANGMATLALDKADAENVAAESDQLYPRNGPHVAVQMVPVQPDGRGTDAQIEKERDIARHAIVGAIAAGHAGQTHPGADHWLAAAHDAGARIAELEQSAGRPRAPCLSQIEECDRQQGLSIKDAQQALDALTALMPNKDDPNHDGHDARDVRKWRALVERLRALTQRPAAQTEREDFEAWLRTKPEARLWNTTDAMLAAYQAGRASLPTQPAAQATPEPDDARRRRACLDYAAKHPVVLEIMADCAHAIDTESASFMEPGEWQSEPWWELSRQLKAEADAERAKDPEIWPTLVFGATPEPIPMVLHCPKCGMQHVDAPDERTPDWKNEPHRSHLCHGCGTIWRPADVPTTGVQAISTKGKADTWEPGQVAPEPVGEAVASIYITPGGDREFDDWKHDLPVGRTILYTRPAPGVPEDGSLLDFMEAHRVAVSPEYEGQWCARQYDDEPQAVAESEAATPRDAIRALAAAQAKGGQA